MANGDQAIAAIVALTGMSHAHVWQTARLLREAGDDLWPQGPRGRSKKPWNVQPHHFANLTLALAIADPLRSVADRVKGFRLLARSDGLTFGQAADAIFERAAKDIGFRDRVWMHQTSIFQVIIGQLPKAIITFGPDAGEYLAPDNNFLHICFLMHVQILGFPKVHGIEGCVIKTCSEICDVPFSADPTPTSEV